MEKALTVVYQEIEKLVQSGRVGTPQVCVFSVNGNSSQEFEERIAAELMLADGLFGNASVVKEERAFEGKPYLHGFIAREYENGAIARYTYTAAPTKASTALTVYGTDGEIRYDTQTGKILTFDQIPDHQGETLTY